MSNGRAVRADFPYYFFNTLPAKFNNGFFSFFFLAVHVSLFALSLSAKHASDGASHQATGSENVAPRSLSPFKRIGRFVVIFICQNLKSSVLREAAGPNTASADCPGFMFLFFLRRQIYPVGLRRLSLPLSQPWEQGLCLVLRADMMGQGSLMTFRDKQLEPVA